MPALSLLPRLPPALSTKRRPFLEEIAVGLQVTATHTRHDSSTQVAPVPANGRETRYVRLAALPSAVPWARRVLRHMLH